MTTLLAQDVAAALGRSVDWLYTHWRDLVEKQGMPRPIHGGGRGGDLIWSEIQFYCWLDRDLPKDLREHAAAMRAAIIAIRGSPRASDDARRIDDWKRKLDERFKL